MGMSRMWVVACACVLSTAVQACGGDDSQAGDFDASDVVEPDVRDAAMDTRVDTASDAVAEVDANSDADVAVVAEGDEWCPNVPRDIEDAWPGPCQETRTVDGEVLDHAVFSYDEQGRQTGVSYVDASGFETAWVEWNWSADGTEVHIIGGSGSSVRYVRRMVMGEWGWVRLEDLAADETVLAYQERTFSDGGCLETLEVLDVNGNFFTYDYEYPSAGRWDEVATAEFRGGRLSQLSRFDERGLVVAHENYSFGELVLSYTREHDADGNLVREERAESLVDEVAHVRTYDYSCWPDG